MSNLKAPGPDGLHGFWLKKFTSLRQAMVHLHDCIETGENPNWMVESRKVLRKKDAIKWNAIGNYRQIACLDLLCKLLTGIINEKVYDHLNHRNLLQEEQIGCRRRTRVTKDQLLIDNAVVCNSRRRYLVCDMG